MLVLVTGLLAFSSPAFADTGADAVILNVVRVDYTDASGNQSFSAEAAAMVTVNLVESAVTISGRPTVGNPGDSGTAPAPLTVASGATRDYLYALTANANGHDTYDLSAGIDAGDTSNVANETITTDLMAPDGIAVLAVSPATVTLGASIVVGRVDADTLLFPGGTLDDVAVDDVVVINGVDYRVAAVTLGSGGSHTYADGAAHSDTGTLTSEVPGQLDLAANASGSNTPPNFADSVIGQIVREQVLVRVSIYAEASVPGTDGIVDISMIIEPDGTTGSNTAQVQNVPTTFTAVDLTIQKLVRNVTASGALGATATGITGDVLEYQVTVTNNGGDAANVTVNDVVPAYTTLVPVGLNFASFTGPSSSGTITSATGIENSDGVSGQALDVIAGTPLEFYVGQGQDGAARSGGLIHSGETFVITYQVRID